MPAPLQAGLFLGWSMRCNRDSGAGDGSVRGLTTIGDERAAGSGMREAQEHGEGTRPLRFNGGGKGTSWEATWPQP